VTPSGSQRGNNACCSWLEFMAGVRRLWRPEYGEIDVHKARIAWGRYSAMPGEFVAAHCLDAAYCSAFPAPPTSTARYPASQHCSTGGGNDVGG
jgi:hypothetical protein